MPDEPTARLEVMIGRRPEPVSGKVEWVNTVQIETPNAAVGQTYTVEVERFGQVTRYLGAPCVSVDDGVATIDLNLSSSVERFRSPAD